MIKRHRDKIENIRFKAKVYGWQEVNFSTWNSLISFRRNGVLMNIYYTKMTVGTAMKHPITGKTQLFRKHVSDKLLEDLFNNPRVHTKIGYSKKMINNSRRWRY